MRFSLTEYGPICSGFPSFQSSFWDSEDVSREVIKRLIDIDLFQSSFWDSERLLLRLGAMCGAFNPLFEIPWQFEKKKLNIDGQFAFNPLFEILALNHGDELAGSYLSILFLRFHMSAVKDILTCNSLSILFLRFYIQRRKPSSYVGCSALSILFLRFRFPRRAATERRVCSLSILFLRFHLAGLLGEACHSSHSFNPLFEIQIVPMDARILTCMTILSILFLRFRATSQCATS